MDDLAGLNWSKESPATKPQNPSYTYSSSAFATLKPTPPASGRATPLNAPSQPPSKPATPANDSFSNLVSFSNSPSTTNPSLQEQQKRLADLKFQSQKNQAQPLQDQYSGADDTLWNSLGSGRSTPAIESQNSKPASKPAVEEEDDILCRFQCFYDEPQSPPVAKASVAEEDDDPFELSKFQAHRTATVKSSTNGFDDNDVLGLLGRTSFRTARARTTRRVYSYRAPRYESSRQSGSRTGGYGLSCR